MTITEVIGVVSALVAGGGLVFVGLQLHVLVRQMRVQSHQAIYAHQQDLDALLFQRLDLKGDS